MSEQTSAPVEPVLSVTRGTPTDEELAALLLVVAAACSGDGGAETEDRGIWAHRPQHLGVRPLSSRNRTSWAWRAGSSFR